MENENSLPDWLKSGPEVNDERISSIELAVYYYEGKMPDYQTPLEWAEEMYKAAKLLTESYQTYIDKLKEDGGKTL